MATPIKQAVRTLSEVYEAKLAELKELESQVKIVDGACNMAELTDEFHSVECRLNHTDGCSYGYEKWGEPLTAYSAKKQWLAKTERLVVWATNHGISPSFVIECRREKF